MTFRVSILVLGLFSSTALAQTVAPPPGTPSGEANTASPAPPPPDPTIPPLPAPADSEPRPEPNEPALPPPAPATPAAPPPAAPATPAPAPSELEQHRHLARIELRTRPPKRAHRHARRGRVHDGFYLRFASGFGVYEERLESDDTRVYGGEVGGRTIGLASVGELALGGTVGKGLVVGGGIYTARLLTGHFRLDPGSPAAPPLELDPELRELLVLGPFVDWYPNPRRGLHLQAALGFAGLMSGDGNFRGDDDDDDDRYRAYGGGIVLGIGYEWWIGEEWSLGALARAQAAAVSAKDEADVRWFHGVSTSPSLLLTLTYH